MFEAWKNAVRGRVIVDRPDVLFGFGPLLLNQRQGAGQVRWKVFGICEEVGECGLDVWVGGRLATERPQIID